MKKMFTTLFAALGMTMAVNAAAVEDIKPMMHSYVCALNNYNANGTVKMAKGELFGSGYFLAVTGAGSVAINKGSIDLGNTSTYATTYGGAEADTARLAVKYAKYGLALNSYRLKNAQDVIAFKPTAGSVVYVFGSGNNKKGAGARVPKFATDAELKNPLNEAPTDEYPASGNYCYKFVVPAEFDGNTPMYIGSYNGDAFFSYIVVEANEPAGTPTVEVNSMVYDEAEKLYYQEVVCTPNDYVLDGDNMGATKVYYTVDGTDPTDASTEYTAPIKCYKDMTVKFQAYLDGELCEGANNEATVEFKFNAPTLTVDGANATIATEYMNATNYYSVSGAEAVAGDAYTATTSCIFKAYTVIKNGDHAEWTSASTSAPIYVLDPIKEKTVITVSGTAVEDPEATAKDPNGLTVYKVEDGKVLVNGAETSTTVFANNPAFKVVKDAQYQVPEGQEVYLQMSGDNLTFLVAEGDSVNVTVTCSKNACKDITQENTLKDDGSINKNNRGCMVNVDGNLYGYDDITIEGNNVITFGLVGGIHTFKKWANTGNILVTSIEITPAGPANGIENVAIAPVFDANAPIYDVVGRQVTAPLKKGIYIQNGHKFIVK